MKRKLFGENKGRGVAGVSLLSIGLLKRTRAADPHAVLAVKGDDKPKRHVKLRKEPLPE